MKKKNQVEKDVSISSALILRTDFIALQNSIIAHLERAAKQNEEAPNYGENDDYKQSQERLVTAKKNTPTDDTSSPKT